MQDLHDCGNPKRLNPIAFTAHSARLNIGTMQSRREFLSDSFKGGAALAVLPFGSLISNRRRFVSLESLHRGSFAPHLNTLFHVDAAKTSVSMLLVQVTGQKTASGENFSLRFRALSKPELDQGTYRFEHDKIGSFELFIVPGEKVAAVRHYRAIINRV